MWSRLKKGAGFHPPALAPPTLIQPRVFAELPVHSQRAQEPVGMVAINDAFLIESAIYKVLKAHFRSKEYYVDLLELMHEVCLVLALLHGNGLFALPAFPRLTATFAQRWALTERCVLPPRLLATRSHTRPSSVRCSTSSLRPRIMLT